MLRWTAAGIAALLTDDAIVMYSERPALVGKEAVAIDQQAFFDRYTIENSKGVVEEIQIAGAIPRNLRNETGIADVRRR